MPTFDLDINAPFDEQLEYFRSKGHLINPAGWESIQAGTHARAFTIAKVAAMDTIITVKEALAASIAAGETVEQFIAALPGIMATKGWLGAKGKWRLETIFRTNLSAAYNVGRYKQQMDVAEARPFWQYIAVLDRKTRPRHRRMHGLIYRNTHPIWRTWYPPNGFQCRCSIRTY
jgi:SPP1 gp7 family putative phage head morphogenesis protein